MKDFFNDCPHQNKLVRINGQTFIQKRLSQNNLLRKEYKIMKFLEPAGLAPKVISCENGWLTEEYLDEWTPLSGRAINQNLIAGLARGLKTLHTLKLSRSLRNLIKDGFVKDMKYHPHLLYKEIEGQGGKGWLGRGKIDILNGFFNQLENHMGSFRYSLCLVHGDLSANNILVKRKRVKIIDWSDSRLDIFTADISQFFYLANLSENQEKTFFSYYRPEWFDDSLFLGHKILLCLYDLTKAYRENKPIDIVKMKKFNALLKSI